MCDLQGLTPSEVKFEKGVYKYVVTVDMHDISRWMVVTFIEGRSYAIANEGGFASINKGIARVVELMGSTTGS